MDLMDAFSEACGDFPAFRAAVVKARDLAADDGTRQHLEHLLGSLDKTFTDFQQTFPKAVESVQQRLTETVEQAKKVQEDAASLQETLARHQAAEAAAAASVSPPALAPAVKLPASFPVLPAMASLDLQEGLRLRDELLNRFGVFSPMPAHGVKDEGSVTDMDAGTWTPPTSEVADEWPEGLRTPSSMKPSKKKRPPPPPSPSSDDESIGKAWEDEPD